MQLRGSPTSPFVRKVRVLALEAGVGERVPMAATDTADPGLAELNPLAKVPTLVLDDGGVLYDSRVIAEYVDATLAGGRFFPPTGPARWTALRRQALGDGIADAAVAIVFERRRPVAAERSEAAMAHQMAKVTRGLAALEREAADLAGIDIGTIAIGCALGYLDLRHADLGWRDGHPALARWFAGFAARPAMAATTPPA